MLIQGWHQYDHLEFLWACGKASGYEMLISPEKHISLKRRVSHRYCQQALEKLDRKVHTFPLPEGQEKEVVSWSTTPRESLKQEEVPEALVWFNSRTSVCFLWTHPHLDTGGQVPGKGWRSRPTSAGSPCPWQVMLAPSSTGWLLPAASGAFWRWQKTDGSKV